MKSRIVVTFEVPWHHPQPPDVRLRQLRNLGESVGLRVVEVRESAADAPNASPAQVGPQNGTK